MTRVLCVAESRNGSLRDVSFELITAGRKLAGGDGDELHVAVVGARSETFAADLDVAGVDVVHHAPYDGRFNHDVYVQALSQLYHDIEPNVVLMPHTVTGMDYAPAVATRLEIPLVSNVFGVTADGTVRTVRKMYDSKVDATVEVDAPSVAVTVREGEWEMETREGDAEIRRFEPEIDESQVTSTVLRVEEAALSDVDLTTEEFIVSIGLGIENEENIELVRELCEATGATLGASRPLIEREWLPKVRQVGQSGQKVQPTVYVAIGISGAIEHLVGMKNSGTIIAINNDPDAPIFDVADYGIVDDLFEAVPELTARFS